MPHLEDSHLNLRPAWRDMLESLLRTHVPQADVWAYGSRVTGGAHEASDLDIVLRNPQGGIRTQTGVVRQHAAHHGRCA